MGLAVFSLSNERAGPKDRKYDPSRPHYKKVSPRRDRLIPTVGTTPTIIYSPFGEGTSGVKKTKEGNSLPWGCLLAGAPFGPVGLLRGFPFWAFRLRWVRAACYAPTAPQQQQQHNNPYSNSVHSNPYSNSGHSNFSSHVTPDLLGDHFIDGKRSTTTITRGDAPRVPPCRGRASLPFDRQGL